MQKLLYTILFTIFLPVISFSQNITEFDNATKIITEDFTNNETSFSILTSADNYFIIDNGDYLLIRNNTESEYAIISSTSQQVSDFILKTSIKLGPSSNNKSSCGIIAKSQNTRNGALIFEINRLGEYRVKELLLNNTYKYLSGKTSNDGWVRNKIIKKQDEFNNIKILSKENIYDIYVNNTFITSVFTPSLNKGNMGILIGKDSKSRIAYYYLNIPSETTNNLTEGYMNDLSAINLSDRIKQLEADISTLSKTNESLEKENISLKNNNLNQTAKNLQDLERNISNKSKEINSLKSEISTLEKEISSLKKKYSSTDNLITQNTSLKLSVSKKESVITYLNTQISQANKTVKELERKRDDLIISDNKKSEDITLLTSTVNELYVKVENMKKVLIYKGFEEGGIDSENISSTKLENNIKEKNILKDVTYRVQIATHGEKVNMAKFKGLKDVYYIDSENGTYLYMSGKFDNSNSAIEHKNKLIEMGYKDAFIVKLNNK